VTDIPSAERPPRRIASVVGLLFALVIPAALSAGGPGELQMRVFWREWNARVTTGQAGYNVAPPTVGIYFEKINCFCFTQQTMKPGEKRDMAVVFYVDPKLAKDSEQDTLRDITLSYTFYPVREPVEPVAVSAPVLPSAASGGG